MKGTEDARREVVVSILIVVFNKVEYTRQCLDAIYRNTTARYPFEVIVVDNASSDGTAEYLERATRQYSDLSAVTNAENLGFVGGNNVAAQHARGRYLCFLNNDTEVAPGWLEPVLGRLEGDSAVGGVGSKLIYPDGRLQEAGGIIFRDASGANYGRYAHPNDPEYNFVRDVDYCSAAALTVRTELFQALGGFDTRYAPAYFEDADLCFGIRSLGHRVVYDHESEVIHHEGVTSGTDLNSGFKRFQVINQPKFAEKWAHVLAEQPERGEGEQYLRSVCDRRTRRGQCVVMGSVEIQQHDRQGGAFRFINMLQILVEAGHHVTCFAQNTRWREPDVDLEPYVHALRRHGVLVYRFDVGFDGRPRKPNLTYLQDLLHARRYDAALLLGGFDSQHFVHVIAQASPWTRIVVDSVDLAYLREGRFLAKQHVPRLWADYEARKWKELGTYKHADAVLTVTERERDLIDRDLGANTGFYMPDLYPAPEAIPAYEERSGLVFLAGFRHPPNVDAVRLLLDMIMPLVRQRLPEVELTVVGDSPPDWLRERADKKTVVTGYVPHLQPYLQTARVAVAPITWGAGIKGKICQTMAVGTPNVTTTIGAEGMGLVDGQEALIADAAEEFADAVVRIYQDRGLWERVSESGRRWIVARHSKRIVSERLEEVLFPRPVDGPGESEGDCFECVSAGYQALRDRRFERSEAIFRSLVERFPAFAESHLGLGRVLLSQRRFDEGAAAMRAALARTDNRLAVQISLADLLLQAAKPGDAAALLEKALLEADRSHQNYGDARDMLEMACNSAMPAYPLWRARHETINRGGEGIVAGSSPSDQVHLFLTHRHQDTARLGDTLDSLGAQLCAKWKLTVVSNAPAPDPLFQQLEVLEWVTVEGDPEAAIAEIARRSNAAWIGFVNAGDCLHPRAIFACLASANVHAEWRMLYTDEDAITAHGVRCDPRFKPDFNLELLRSMPYLGGLTLIRGGMQPVLADGAAARTPVWSCDTALRLYERFGESAIGHIPEVLYHRRRPAGEGPAAEAEYRTCVDGHLKRSGVSAKVGAGLVAGTNFIEYIPPRWPLVSIIVPTRDRLTLLEPCIESLLQRTRYPAFEVLVVDNDSRDPDALAYLKALPARDRRVRVLSFPDAYNFSTMNNVAARAAGGEYLLLLNNDTLIVQPNWLERMMAQAQRPDVGIVGCRLVYPDKRIQHAGVILGMGHNGVGEHTFLGQSMNAPGYMNRAQVAQEFSAVTGACLLIRRSVYDEVGGLDQENLAVMYNDIDLCLKVRSQGYRVIWTPFSTLVHHCGASLQDGYYGDPAKLEQARREAAAMLDRWLPILCADPAYNRNLSLVRMDPTCDVEVATGWNAPGRHGLRIMGLSAGSEGSHEHRVTIPLRVLARERVAHTAVLPKYADRVRVPSVAELARERPGTLLAHNAVHDIQLQALENYRRFNRDVFLVFSQDDLMVDLPEYNEFRAKLYPDIEHRLRRGMAACQRLIVTTQPLAEAYRSWADDIRIVPNCIDAGVWKPLTSGRNRGPKPRVGWAGAQQHGGDLEIIFDLVRETSGQIDWVFFGLCFRELLPYVAEVHDPVPFDQYPSKLASLDLDLGVAPLVDNRFNEAKSNLKVLEYGALGIPVVCSDLEPYRGAPVALVANTTAAWKEAILARVHELGGAAREGDALRDWVYSDWTFQNHVEDWLGALLPGAAAERIRETAS